MLAQTYRLPVALVDGRMHQLSFWVSQRVLFAGEAGKRAQPRGKSLFLAFWAGSGQLSGSLCGFIHDLCRFRRLAVPVGVGPGQSLHRQFADGLTNQNQKQLD